MANTNAIKPQDSSIAEKTRGVGQAASELASAVGEKASDAASAVGHKAADAAATVGQKADDATSAVGSGIKHLAGTIREKTPDSGVIGNVSGAVADTMENAGRYIEDRQLSGMAKDVTDIVRRHPLPAILIGIGLGFLIARMMTSTTRS